MKSIKDTITAQYLSKLDSMNISIYDIVNNFYSGIRKSNSNGISFEFSDFKQYIAGDDIRHIDWNSYAHTDRVYIKRYNEERQATINIFLDLSKSMYYYDKGYSAKLIAASIAYIALKDSDRVCIFVCNQNLELNKIYTDNKNLFINIISFLDDIDYDGNTMLTKTISKLSNTEIHRGISFILSDFFSEDGYKAAIKSLKYKKQQIIAIHILSKYEIFPENEGNIKFIDSETGEFYEISIDENIIQQYKIEFKKFQTDIEQFCSSLGAAYRLLSPEIPVIQQLVKYFSLK